MLAAATPPTGGNGTFDVNLQTSGATPQLLFDQVQTVSTSGNFISQTINFGTSGSVDVTLNDLGYPSQFQTLALIASSNGTVLGKIYSGGTFPIATAPGTYQFAVVAIPADQQQYGLYGIGIVNSAPTVTLSAMPTTVAAGSVTTLSWTSANATACTAGGGSFTGNEATGSGTLAVTVTATTTYTLACTGPGGSKTASVMVTATAAPSGGGGGGGGGIGTGEIGALLFLMLIRVKHTGVRFEKLKQ